MYILVKVINGDRNEPIPIESEVTANREGQNDNFIGVPLHEEDGSWQGVYKFNIRNFIGSYVISLVEPDRTTHEGLPHIKAYRPYKHWEFDIPVSGSTMDILYTQLHAMDGSFPASFTAAPIVKQKYIHDIEYIIGQVGTDALHITSLGGTADHIAFEIFAYPEIIPNTNMQYR